MLAWPSSRPHADSLALYMIASLILGKMAVFDKTEPFSCEREFSLFWADLRVQFLKPQSEYTKDAGWGVILANLASPFTLTLFSQLIQVQSFPHSPVPVTSQLHAMYCVILGFEHRDRPNYGIGVTIRIAQAVDVSFLS